MKPIWSEARLELGFLRKIRRGRAWECWEWSGAPGPKGYGQCSFKGTHTNPHRVSYELAFGPIPDGLQIDHLCRNKMCVNPYHLEAVTAAENLRRADVALGIRSAATHCRQGHSLDDAYVRKLPGGGEGRACAECAREYSRAYARRKRSTV